ncbi:hypothetical protein [Pseudophaeobacter sp.]|uniref:hypothetical protein n=1 Tax=Pseudophaeobacter sp. TaxID=1971739 RepID=UPI004058B484
MPEYPESAGMAALSICEALLLALKDLQVMPEHEISGILRDAAAFHENAAGTIAEIERNQKAAALINQINANGNSTR